MYLVSRTETFAKLFFIVSFTGLFMYVALAFYSFHTAYSTVSQISGDHYRNRQRVTPERFSRDLKYILLWSVRNVSLVQEGQAPFIYSDCPNINCYITLNRSILNGNYTNFDAIVLDATSTTWYRAVLPQYRSPRQKYVFYSNLPPEEYPVCNIHLNNYFNWTWTYKLDSDIVDNFIEVKNMEGKVIAPRPNVVWPKNNWSTLEPMDNIDEVNTKTKALVWIIKLCHRRKTRAMISIKKLQAALEEHSLVFDIYGCGNLQCPKEGCMSIIERDYYFYLVYEESIASDFVSSAVVDAYHHGAVPIIISGADLTMFLPDGSYINYQGNTEETLASYIAHTLRSPSKYRQYFNWKRRYTIDTPAKGTGYCRLCTLLNEKMEFERYSTYTDFIQWWNRGNLKNKCLPKGAEVYTELESYMNDTTR